MNSNTLLSIVVLSLLGYFSIAASASSGPARLDSDCGWADFPVVAPTTGVICIGVCADRASRQTCVVSTNPAPVGTPVEPIAAPKSISFVLRGDGVAVSDFAARFSKLTGWDAQVYGGIESAFLRPQAWRGPWKRFDSLKLKTEDGQPVRVVLDESQRALRFVPER